MLNLILYPLPNRTFINEMRMYIKTLSKVFGTVSILVKNEGVNMST